MKRTRMRKHPTASLGVMPEINTVHAFGASGHETSGWPFRSSAIPGYPAGGTRVYRPARLSQDELGDRRPRRRKKKR